MTATPTPLKRERPARRHTAPEKPAAPKQQSVTNKRETITPEIAYQWLERNKKNRPITQATVDRFARDMKAGRWHLTGEPIQFGFSGRLLNGQHRLWACIEANVAFETYVVRGIVNEEEVMDVIDTGKKRTLSDALTIHGEKSTRTLASIVSLCWRYEFDRLRSGAYPTHEEGLYWLEQNPQARDAAALAAQAWHAIRCPQSSGGAAYYLNSRVDSEAAETFWQLAITGEGLLAGDPILAFRRWAYGATQKRDKPTAPTWFSYALKAMNLWRDGKTVRLLVVKDDEPVPEVWK